MQTFVPYIEHWKTAAILDDQRLFKQTVESKQIILALKERNGWSSHPAALMWDGYIPALIEYTSILASEWEFRGITNRGKEYNQSFTSWAATLPESNEPIVMPPWWGGPIHYTHLLKLLWKYPAWYEPKLKMTAPSIEPRYFWPVRKNND